VGPAKAAARATVTKVLRVNSREIWPFSGSKSAFSAQFPEKTGKTCGNGLFFD
jgi:hypothetical protein